ncbi:MAG TPA: SAM-dependent methyltransferase [Kofleriaceae bacterium]|nr:SAM-dependent methyltransferase [Kofleriaceae bacterium]
MKEGIPSSTAELMAVLRATGEFLQENEILVDPYAKHFLSKRFSWLHSLVRLGLRPLNRGITSLSERLNPGTLGWVLTRHRYLDDAIHEAMRAGATQVVIVGAGYDSRAFRLPALSAARIFELDHPATQARKKEIVRRIFGDLPKHINYVSWDAQQQDLQQLPELGFDRNTRAVFVLEGFLWYMSPEDARAILRSIAQVAAPGSVVIFDYILPSVVDGSCTLEFANKLREQLAQRGEPIRSGIEPEHLASYLRENGLRLVDDVGHDQLRERYMGRGGWKIKIYEFLRIARAETDPAAPRLPS